MEKSLKFPFIIYVDLGFSVKKICTCHINPEKASTTQINEHTPSNLLATHC